ncbi:MAG: glycoside hydrolase family 16 protein [Oscillospiraceae bacterium]|jgi:beta-glucanase (GH16 family)|nr:glycoside hydrolase family 16 protein [Oscillospiraceae bacterium]
MKPAKRKRPAVNLWGADALWARALNYLISPVHELITLSRRPWGPKGGTLDLSGYTLAFEDTFEGDAIDGDTWQPHGEGQRKGGYWDQGQARLEGGKLAIRTEYKGEGPYGAGYYTWGAMTKGSFERAYGYFEARCILPSAQGLWAAFWLMSDEVKAGVPGTRATEVDIVESPLWKRHRGEGLVTQNLHYNGYGFGTRYRNAAVARANNPYEQFNTYGLLWTPDEYIFYVNGMETGRSRFGGVCREPLYMLLSVEVDGVGGVPCAGWSGNITKNRAGALPADFVVDYVRVYAPQ